jgi:hypothetical protein
LLDSAQVLCHDMSKRIAALRKKLPGASPACDEDDVHTTLCTSIRHKLLMHLPVRALSPSEDSTGDVYEADGGAMRVTEAMALFQALCSACPRRVGP